jgi:hypothetical protein
MKQIILGYSLDSVGNNERGMFEKIELPNKENIIYSNIYDINLYDVNFKIGSKKKFDMSVTYDGFTIISEKFRMFCLENNYEGLEFLPLKKEIGFFWFKINNILLFDFESRKTKFSDYNEQNSKYASVHGATPVHLEVKDVLKDGFYRTDIFFGHHESKKPIEIVGTQTKDKMKKFGLRGIYFEKIFDYYP